MRLRLFTVSTLLAVLVSGGMQLQPAKAGNSPYCDPYGDPNVYQACIALQQSQHQQQQNEADLRAVEAQQADTEQAIIDLENLIAQIQNEINGLETQIALTKSEIDALTKEIAALDADIARRQARINEREQLLARRVRAQDMYGQINYLQVIVNSSSFTDLIDRIVTVQEIVQSDHKLIEDLRAQRKAVQDERKQRGDELSDRNRKLASLQAQEDQEASLEADRQAALDYEQQHQIELQALQAKLQAAQAAINAQVVADQQAYAAAAAAAGGGSGQFSWPEHGGFYISQGFGCTDYPLEPYDPNCPQKHFHAGIDMAGPYGADIYAADTGIVSLGYDQYGYGNYIVITHGNGWSTLYGHLSGYNVSDGQTVQRGAVIGFEGSTGNSSGPHLHFGVMLNGSWVNPCAYLIPSC